MKANLFDIENSIETLMNKQGIDLELAIEHLRKDTLYNQAAVLKEKLFSEGRCPICTLQIPCKHYLLPNEAKKPPKNYSTKLLQVAIPSSPKSTQISTTPDASHMKIRYRGRKKTESPKNYFQSDELEKLKLMEKLEKYKEEKLQREIEHIEEIKRIEEIEKIKTKEIQKKQELYYLKQKEKLK